MSDKFIISNKHLIRLAGKPAFNRGMGYFRGGHVLRLQQKGNRITAEVEGSEICQVTINVRKEILLKRMLNLSLSAHRVLSGSGFSQSHCFKFI